MSGARSHRTPGVEAAAAPGPHRRPLLLLGSSRRLSVLGDVDETRLPDLRERLNRLSGRVCSIRLDDVTYLPGGAVGVLQSFAARARSEGRRVQLSARPGSMARPRLDLLGLGHLVRSEELASLTPEEAVRDTCDPSADARHQ